MLMAYRWDHPFGIASRQCVLPKLVSFMFNLINHPRIYLERGLYFNVVY